MSIAESVKCLGLVQAFHYLDKDPEKNLPKLMEWIDRFSKKDVYPEQRRAIRQIISDENNNWYQLIHSLYTDIDSEVRKTLFENFVLNATLLGSQKIKASKQKYDCNVPWAILMDPTSACNLHCTGCWAAEYGDKLNMSFETLSSIVEQAKELGIHMFLYSGGEPLVRKKDILELCKKHPDCVFTAFTNGTLIDEEFAEAMLDVKNFVPAISVEGFEKETDFRRGEGTFSKVVCAMKILKEKKLPFGISCCYTKKNYDVIGSEAYFDQMIQWGAKFCWFFTYMPVGKEAVPELMATAEQREYMYHQIRNFRKTKPLLTIDFWNDGEYINGCIAGGRNYLHINANGDIEPCAFIHYSNSNIHKDSLLDALHSPLFMEYRKNQPFNENHLRPCPLLDNPGRLTAMVESSEAHSTDLEAPEDVRNLSDKCVASAQNWAPLADELWEKTHPCAECVKCDKKII
ncbi:radical SAM protein [Sinanaerobacter sp. ZZT-01]|uniref:radical SAM protein n=1 Tax=Sinanaerobacter sp. ZZT-01 TaxID=3111540 RepID=UPI002D796224|nr:radical SAM protein [Sinanaerobacter sp. ZZT-01]WRR93252.1 radical SAM protein [Sinanaerobacter sp. ZZT-01]